MAPGLDLCCPVADICHRRREQAAYRQVSSFRVRPSIDERQGRELAELAFVRGAANVFFLFGVWPYDRMASTALLTPISARCERGSIILTSNKRFAEWGEEVGDTVIATAILDRLLHHSHVINIRCESYWLREKRQAGLFGFGQGGGG